MALIYGNIVRAVPLAEGEYARRRRTGLLYAVFCI